MNMEIPLSLPEKKPETIAEFRSIHRGVWADRLEDGQELPLGGSMFSDELTSRLVMDFDAFEDQLKSYTPENFRAVFEKTKDAGTEWLEKNGIDTDPYTFFVCQNIQNKLNALLEIAGDDPVEDFRRSQAYFGGKTPKLSELKGMTACAEQAALTQYLLQRIGIESAYVGGVTMQDAMDKDEYSEPHSFVILKNVSGESQDLVFDVARPHTSSIPRIMRTKTPISYEVLQGKDEYLIEATDIIPHGRNLWFGVGDPVAGKHEVSS